jgi:hypothetical protein
MSIVLLGSTSGSVTLQEPAVAGTTVLDLPAVSGTVITTGTTGQVIDSGALPVGSVLQVVNATTSTVTSSSSGTYADTGLTATITPKFSTSKILVLVDQNGVGKNASATIGVDIRLQRSGSTIVNMNFYAAYTGTAIQNNVGSVSTNYLDSPATTSATTYKTQFANPGATSLVFVQNSGETSTITLMEIAA